MQFDGPIQLRELVLSKKTGEWCQLPYPLHPYGCPNYNKKKECPPDAPFITEILDTDREMCFVCSGFNLYAHMLHMRHRHPEWSIRQLRNVLYWQPKARKKLRGLVKDVQFAFDLVFYCPEAHGVNVYATARKHGLKLQKIKDITICRHIALLGFKNNAI